MHRSLSDTEMDDLLRSEIFCHLACCEAGKPYVLPLAYVFHKDAIYGQTTEGKKIDILRRNPLVCFQVEKKEERQWQSVMCWGSFEELDVDQLEKAEAMIIFKLLTEHLGSIQKNVGIDLPIFTFHEKVTAVKIVDKTSTLFRIPIAERTGMMFVAD